MSVVGFCPLMGQILAMKLAPVKPESSLHRSEKLEANC
jgi:hypothetical protein